MRIRIGSARALKQHAYSFARDSVTLGDFTGTQQLAVTHFGSVGMNGIKHGQSIDRCQWINEPHRGRAKATSDCSQLLLTDSFHPFSLA